MEYQVKIMRLYQQPTDSEFPKQTLGELYVMDKTRLIYMCKVLELPWMNNARRISCVPAGKYMLNSRYTKRHGKHWILNDVPNRSFILIHAGNYYTHTLGCILVGSHFRDINKNGLCDVVNSNRTMDELRAILGDNIPLTIEWRT